jgi:hypothetical protein
VPIANSGIYCVVGTRISGISSGKRVFAILAFIAISAIMTVMTVMTRINWINCYNISK